MIVDLFHYLPDLSQFQSVFKLIERFPHFRVYNYIESIVWPWGKKSCPQYKGSWYCVLIECFIKGSTVCPLHLGMLSIVIQHRLAAHGMCKAFLHDVTLNEY